MVSNAPRPRLLVTGASGFLGRRVLACAAPRAEVVAVVGASQTPLRAAAIHRVDLSRPSDTEALFLRVAPDAVIHTAAVNPGSPRATPERIWSVNVEGTRAIAAAAHAAGARFVHVSTDVVHDGADAPYADDAPTTARTGYAGSKAAGERAVLEVCPRAVLVRTSLLYAPDEMDRQTAAFAAALARDEPVRFFGDVLRQPIAATSLANALLALALDHPEIVGTLNIAGEDALTRDAFGRRLLEHFRVGGRERVSTTRAALLANPPPLDLRLRIERAQRLLGLRFPGPDTVLADR